MKLTVKITDDESNTKLKIAEACIALAISVTIDKKHKIQEMFDNGEVSIEDYEHDMLVIEKFLNNPPDPTDVATKYF